MSFIENNNNSNNNANKLIKMNLDKHILNLENYLSKSNFYNLIQNFSINPDEIVDYTFSFFLTSLPLLLILNSKVIMTLNNDYSRSVLLKYAWNTSNNSLICNIYGEGIQSPPIVVSIDLYINPSYKTQIIQK